MIKVAKIIQDRGLDTKEVARELFPDNSFPDMALKRILDGKALLNSTQVSKLAYMSGLGISQLYLDGWGKKASSEEFVVTKNNIRAVLNLDEWVMKVYCNDSLVHTEVLQKPSIPLKEYLANLDALTKTHGWSKK